MSKKNFILIGNSNNSSIRIFKLKAQEAQNLRKLFNCILEKFCCNGAYVSTSRILLMQKSDFFFMHEPYIKKWIFFIQVPCKFVWSNFFTVYVFIGEHIALIDFVNCLERRGLLKNGEYVVISVDDEIYRADKSSSMWRRDYIDPYISSGQLSDISAFRNVLKLSPSYPRNPDY